MKKLYTLIAAVLVLGCGSMVMAADSVNVPSANGANPLDSAAYGGVDYATSSFSAGIATGCLNCVGVINGMLISSDTVNDFVDVFDSTACNITPGDDKLVWRVYAGTSTVAFSGGSIGTISMLQYPIRFTNGLCFRPSVATLNKVTVLYYKRRGVIGKP